MNTIDNLAHTDSLEMLAMQSDIHEYNPTLKETMEEVADNLLFFVPRVLPVRTRRLSRRLWNRAACAFLLVNGGDETPPRKGRGVVIAKA
jgi:hypothetical protein